MSVSYLITLYNKEPFIGGVMDAVLAEQAKTGGEIIVYDDVSTDRSVAIVQERIAAHPDQSHTVHVIHGDRNRGVGFATNRVIELAAQPYTRIVDADDILVRGSTAQMLRHLKKNKLGFIFGHNAEVGEKKTEELESQPYESFFMLNDPVRRILRHTIAGTSPSLFVTKELRKAWPVPEWIKRTQDFMLTLRMANMGIRMGYVKDIVALGPASSRTDTHLSSSLAAMFAEISRDVAHDGKNLPLPYLRYASSRYAGRAAKYFRRRGKSKLRVAEKATLWRWRHSAWLAPRQTCIDRLNRIADLFERDRNVVIKG